MIQTLRSIWHRHPWLALGFSLASLLALVFLGRFLWSVGYWMAHHEEPLRPWMTIGYVGRSWDVPPQDLAAMIGFDRPEGKPMTLTDIARERGIAVADLIAEIETAIATARAAQK